MCRVSDGGSPIHNVGCWQHQLVCTDFNHVEDMGKNIIFGHSQLSYTKDRKQPTPTPWPIKQYKTNKEKRKRYFIYNTDLAQVGGIGPAGSQTNYHAYDENH